MLGSDYLHDDSLGELLSTASVARLAAQALDEMPSSPERDRHAEKVAEVIEDHHRELALRAIMAWRAHDFGAQG